MAYLIRLHSAAVAPFGLTAAALPQALDLFWRFLCCFRATVAMHPLRLGLLHLSKQLLHRIRIILILLLRHHLLGFGKQLLHRIRDILLLFFHLLPRFGEQLPHRVGHILILLQFLFRIHRISLSFSVYPFSPMA